MMTTNDNNEFVSDTMCMDNYRKGWKLIFATFGTLLAVILLYAMIRAPLDASDKGEDGFGGIGLLALPYWIFVVGPIGMSFSWVFLRAARKEETQIVDMFAVFKRNYWNAVAAGVLRTLIIGFGFLFLIVPGVIFACCLAFVDDLIIDRKMEAMESLRASWAMTKGYGGAIFGMYVLAFLLGIAGFLALIVGVFIAFMWITAAFAVLYHSVCLNEEDATLVREEPATG